MDYGMIGKIEKAKRYAEERDRITFNNFAIRFNGDNNSYDLSFHNDEWHCTCPGFQTHQICPHLMCAERVFNVMIKREKQPYAAGQNVVSDVEKSKRYSEETDRMTINTFQVTFAGNNSDHHAGYANHSLNCDCDFFATRNVCSHTMAMERILGTMIGGVAADAGDA